MSRLRIVHQTGFRYGGDVTASYNEARMLPQTSGHQLVLYSNLSITPHANMQTYRDYWGTKVSAFELLGKHDSLTLRAESLVEVQDHSYERGTLGWAEIADLARHQVSLMEQIEQTPRTAPPVEVIELARTLAAGKTPHDAAEAISLAIGDRIRYVQGSTSVFTTAKDSWMAHAGVCQDIAHITIGALRSVGIPARYVSGYLHPDDDAGVGEMVAGESHAWVEWFTGAWVGFDPTNSKPAGGKHVVVGRGRDYTDVPPLKGVYAGPYSSELFVTVEVALEA